MEERFREWWGTEAATILAALAALEVRVQVPGARMRRARTSAGAAATHLADAATAAATAATRGGKAGQAALHTHFSATLAAMGQLADSHTALREECARVHGELEAVRALLDSLRDEAWRELGRMKSGARTAAPPPPALPPPPNVRTV